ncbi:MAG: glycosyltransferase family 4 protein [Betaproteobacteria bacterium]|nr:glycosyltransferase family 4 protein [Betaproteobacteria bacterium]
MEAHIQRLSQAQRNIGIDVLNVFNRGVADEHSVQVFRGIDLRGIAPAVLRNLVFYFGVWLARRRLVRTDMPTVLHVHGDWSDFLFSKTLARAIGAALVVASIHGSAKKNSSQIYRRSLSHCQLVFATGKREQEFLATVLGRTVHHLPSAPLDVFCKAVAPSKTTSYDVITVANFVEAKSLDLVLDCAAHRPEWRFAIVGGGPGLAGMRELAARRSITNVDMPGPLPPERVADILRSTRVFLLVSKVEGTPTALLEAMACGLPVVTTPSNEYGWLIEQGVHGYISKSWVAEELLFGIERFLSNGARREAICEVNQARARSFTWAENAERVAALIAQHLGVKGVHT